MVVFPGWVDDNQELSVKTLRPGLEDWQLALILTVAALMLLVLLCLCLRRKQQTDASKDDRIIAALRQENVELFEKLLGDRNILRVEDCDKNNIFHLAAAEDWTEGMTEVLVEHLRKKGRLDQTGAVTREDIYTWWTQRCLTDWTLASCQYRQARTLESRNCRGETPLHVAAAHGQTQIVAALLKLNVRLDVKDERQFTPLHHAVERGVGEIQNLLVAADNSWDTEDGHKVLEGVQSLQVSGKDIYICY